MRNTLTYTPQSQFLEMFGSPITNPKGWPTEQIKDVAPESPAPIKPVGKTWLLNLDMIEPQTGDIIDKVYEEAEDTLSVLPFDNGNVLFSKLRPYLNKVVVPDENGLATTELVPLRPKGNKLNKTFLLCLLRSDQFVSFANEISGGTKMPRMPLSELRKFNCILPPMELQTQFETIHRQADKSKFDGFKSQFLEMCSDIVDKKPLSDLLSENFPGEWGSEPNGNDSIKVIRTTNFTNEGKLDLNDVVERSIDSKKVAKKQLKKGDIILERSGGTKDNPVGRVVIFEEDGKYLFNNFTQLLRPNSEVNSTYLFYYLFTSYNVNKALMRAMASQTTGIQNLNMSNYLAKTIELPSNDVQTQFEAIYRQADKSKYYELN